MVNPSCLRVKQMTPKKTLLQNRACPFVSDTDGDVCLLSMKKDTDPIKSKGRIFGRIGEMWRPFASILGDSVGRDVDDDRQAYTAMYVYLFFQFICLRFHFTASIFSQPKYSL